MAIANGTCVSFCNQPKAHFASPGYAHGTWDNRGKCHMDKKRIQCVSNASQHVPIHLQPFPSNSTRKFKSSPFEHIFAHFGLQWVRSWDNRGKCYDGKRIQCWSNACSTYPSIFNRLRAIARYWSKIATFSYPLAFNAPVGGVPIGIPGKSLVLRNLESWGYQAVKTV